MVRKQPTSQIILVTCQIAKKILGRAVGNKNWGIKKVTQPAIKLAKSSLVNISVGFLNLVKEKIDREK